MNSLLRAMPVLFACHGCEHDGRAPEAAQALDRLGVGEAYPAGSEAARARARFPIYAIEGCRKACATAWLTGIGVRPHRCFFLDEAKGITEEVERIAAELRR